MAMEALQLELFDGSTNGPQEIEALSASELSDLYNVSDPDGIDRIRAERVIVERFYGLLERAFGVSGIPRTRTEIYVDRAVVVDGSKSARVPFNMQRPSIRDRKIQVILSVAVEDARLYGSYFEDLCNRTALCVKEINDSYLILEVGLADLDSEVQASQVLAPEIVGPRRGVRKRVKRGVPATFAANEGFIKGAANYARRYEGLDD